MNGNGRHAEDGQESHVPEDLILLDEDDSRFEGFYYGRPDSSFLLNVKTVAPITP